MPVEWRRRPRRYLPGQVLPLLNLVGFRHDDIVDGYVLWFVGRRRGPVFRDRQRRTSH